MIRQFSIGLATCLLTASCSPDKPAVETRPGLVVATQPGKSHLVESDMPIPPKDAQYTIYCQSMVGPDHYERSRALRAMLRDATPMKDWYVVHGNDKSTLYYGFYRSIDPRDPADGAEGKRAIGDLDTIRAMTDTNGGRPFATSLPVLIDSPDPSTNPAWDLARTDGYWSLQIGAYRGSPQRKEAAVEAVRQARAMGIDAYYYHGKSVSSVCIGSWPKEAAREIDTAQQNVDPNVPLVVTSKPMSPALAKKYNDNGINTAAPEVQPIDPTLIDAMRRFPDHAVNGMVDPHKSNHSFLVKVPHGESDDDVEPMVDQTVPLPPQHADERPGMGRLPSLGD